MRREVYRYAEAILDGASHTANGVRLKAEVSSGDHRLVDALDGSECGQKPSRIAT